MPLRVLLLSTAPRGSLGSMGRYGRLVAQALATLGGGTVDVRTRCLSLPAAALRRLPPFLATAFHHGWVAIAAARARRETADVTHLLDGSHGYVLDSLPGRCLVVTCHDMIPMLQEQGQLGSRPGRGARGIVRRSAAGLRGAHRVAAISACTARDAQQWGSVAPGRIRVIPLPLDPRFAALLSSGEPRAGRAPGEGEARILHVGTDAFYKNRTTVLRVAARVARDRKIRLVLAGTPPDGNLCRLAESLALKSRMEIAGRADDDRLLDLYRGAGVFLFPSLYEGFGWPVLEAMACGCPVVCSTAGALPEVAGGAALSEDPLDVERLAAAVLSILTDPTLAGNLARRGRERASAFTMTRLADDLRALYREAASEAAVAPGDPPRRTP